MMDHEDIAAASGTYPEVYRALMCVGLLGTVYRAGSDAQIVGTAVEATLADTKVYTMYQAIADGMGGREGFAIRSLMAHVQAHPEDETAKVTLAVSMLVAGDPQWKHWIDNVLASSHDPAVRDAANGILAYLGSVRSMH